VEGFAAPAGAAVVMIAVAPSIINAPSNSLVQQTRLRIIPPNIGANLNRRWSVVTEDNNVKNDCLQGLKIGHLLME
jgi:hypothetical protein